MFTYLNNFATQQLKVVSQRAQKLHRLYFYYYCNLFKLESKEFDARSLKCFSNQQKWMTNYYSSPAPPPHSSILLFKLENVLIALSLSIRYFYQKTNNIRSSAPNLFNGLIFYTFCSYCSLFIFTPYLSIIYVQYLHNPLRTIKRAIEMYQSSFSRFKSNTSRSAYCSSLSSFLPRLRFSFQKKILKRQLEGNIIERIYTRIGLSVERIILLMSLIQLQNPCKVYLRNILVR